MAAEDGWLVPETSRGQADLDAQLGQAVGEDVTEFDHDPNAIARVADGSGPG